MSDKTKIYIIDFDDSFTFNIAAELYSFEKGIKVISHRDFFSDRGFSRFFKKIEKPTAIILGPGPGAPTLYGDYFPNIRALKNNSFLYLMGICLGHQVLGLMDGLVIKPSHKPIHGGQVKINFENIPMMVQRYNSLAVYESQESLEEIQIRQWDRGVSYQFHPESIGSENRFIFFRDLLKFIH